MCKECQENNPCIRIKNRFCPFKRTKWIPVAILPLSEYRAMAGVEKAARKYMKQRDLQIIGATFGIVRSALAKLDKKARQDER
jgi:hypothetical protein